MQNQTTPPIPAAYLDANASWRRQGYGIFEWSVFKIYEATLWACSKADVAKFDANAHFALQLHYLRSIDAQQLADSTMSEIRRLTPKHTPYFDVWAMNLRAICPNIKRGDELTIEFRPSTLKPAGARFFFNDSYLGEINDTHFANAFAAIWLDSRTKAPALRTKLLGLGC